MTINDEQDNDTQEEWYKKDTAVQINSLARDLCDDDFKTDDDLNRFPVYCAKSIHILSRKDDDIGRITYSTQELSDLLVEDITHFIDTFTENYSHTIKQFTTKGLETAYR